jgi:hypothetical protein
MEKTLNSIICQLNLTFFNLEFHIRESKNSILHQANIRHQRLKDHKAILVPGFKTISDLFLAEDLVEC